jgi:hypothetical protein
VKKQTVKQKSTTNFPRKQNQIDFLLGELDMFSKLMTYGYSENNWSIASEVYHNLCGFLCQKERDMLADIWRESFTHRDEKNINNQINLIKARLHNN